MVRKPETDAQDLQSFKKARRRALARLRTGQDLRWTPSATRNELHRRERHAATGRRIDFGDR